MSQTVFTHLDQRFDREHGGFGRAPKFPQPAQTMHFLTRFAALNLRAEDDQKLAQGQRARDMALLTLVKVYNGGIRDVVGGGFARYSVDEKWHIPHCTY